MNKETEGKLPLNLVPPRAIESLAQVRKFGNKKYKDPWGWLNDVDAYDFIEAAKRHMLRCELEDNLYAKDSESGLMHLEHALCSLAMAVEILRRFQDGN